MNLLELATMLSLRLDGVVEHDERLRIIGGGEDADEAELAEDLGWVAGEVAQLRGWLGAHRAMWFGGWEASRDVNATGVWGDELG